MDDNEVTSFPEPSAPCARMGLISPEGEFYPCAYTAHKDLAYMLCEKYYGGGDGLYYLEQHGWISIGASASIHMPMNKDFDLLDTFTERQKDTMRAIVEAFEQKEADNPDIDWNRVLQDNPEDYYLVGFWTYPCDNLPENNTFAQKLRYCYNGIFEYEDVSSKSTPKALIDAALRYKYAEHPGD